MRVLSRALRHQGEPIPLPWPELLIRPGPGDVVLGLAAPGVGKSFVALNWAVHLAQEGKPVLMISTDTSYQDQAVRTAALLSGKTMDEVEKDQAASADDLARRHLPIRWSELHLKADDISDFLKAEVEYLGEAPDFVVVDVISDLMGSLEESSSAYSHIMTELKKAARRFQTTIFALHHVSEGAASSGTQPVKLRDILYKSPGRIAPIVLGMWRNGTGILTVAILKNRMGRANADAIGVTFDLRVDYSRAKVRSRW